jgi:hypothetical protein
MAQPKLTTEIPELGNKKLWQAIDDSRFLLATIGLLKPSESARVQSRLIRRANAEGIILKTETTHAA